MLDTVLTASLHALNLMTIVTLQNNIKRLVIVTLQMKFSVTLKFSVISKLTE